MTLAGMDGREQRFAVFQLRSCCAEVVHVPRRPNWLAWRGASCCRWHRCGWLAGWLACLLACEVRVLHALSWCSCWFQRLSYLDMRYQAAAAGGHSCQCA
jgi:hypothetical protein